MANLKLAISASPMMLDSDDSSVMDSSDDSCSHQERNKVAANRYSGKTQETPVHNIGEPDDSSSEQSYCQKVAPKVASVQVPASSKGSKRKAEPPSIKVNTVQMFFDVLK